jgi:two-component system chemotaxis response regulator CheB
MSSRGQTGKVRVMVVDDSAYNRQTIISILQSSPDISVVGRAANGEEALREVLRLRPDVITLDLEMPKMDGFTFLRILMSRQPTPVIVISSYSHRNNVFKALELGALDFIAKPTQRVSPELASIQEELIGKVLLVRQLRTAAPRPIHLDGAGEDRPDRAESAARLTGASARGLVVIGASTGGPPALQLFFQEIAWDLPVAYLVAQHMPVNFTKAFAERLDRSLGLSVREALGAERLEAGQVYVAPGGSNLTVVRRGADLFTAVEAAPAQAKYVPSIDVLFRSAADAYGQRVAALLMTGMGSDGSIGIRAIKEAGGLTMAESEDSAVIFGMPREAIATGYVDLVLHQNEFAQQVVRFAHSLDLERAEDD